MKSTTTARSLALSASLEIVQSGITSAPALRRLAKAEVFGLDVARAATLACVEGSLWVTLEGDPADYVLEAGQDMILPRHGRAVVESLGNSSLSLA